MLFRKNRIAQCVEQKSAKAFIPVQPGPIDWSGVKSGMAFVCDNTLYWYIGQDFEAPHIRWFSTVCMGITRSKLACFLDTKVQRAGAEYDFVVRRR